MLVLKTEILLEKLLNPLLGGFKKKILQSRFYSLVSE